MPKGDRTGPAGMGSTTGRAAGFCAGYQVPGYMNPVGERGYWGIGRGGRPWGGGRGRCFGGGRGRMFGSPHPTDMTAEQETAILEDQVTFLKKQTDAVKSRIDELKGQQEKTNSKKKS